MTAAWEWIRRALTFGIGAALVVDAFFFNSEVPVLEAVLGLVLMGIAPIDWFMTVLPRGAIEKQQARPDSP